MHWTQETNAHLGLSMQLFIMSNIFDFASVAFCTASITIFNGSPGILISACSAVIPFFVPAILKSISPK